MSEAQLDTRGVSAWEFVTTPAFAQGVGDKLAGIEPRDVVVGNEVICYAAGRLFVAWCWARGEAVPRVPRKGERKSQHRHFLALWDKAEAAGIIPEKHR